jgi:hypothetical protein
MAGNGYDEGKARNYFGRVESLLDELATERGEFMKRCRVLRDQIGEVVTEARDDLGVPKKAFRAVVREHELRRKLDAVRDGLEDNDLIDAFDLLKVALGDFADLPLGAAALAKAQPTILDAG